MILHLMGIWSIWLCFFDENFVIYYYFFYIFCIFDALVFNEKWVIITDVTQFTSVLILITLFNSWGFFRPFYMTSIRYLFLARAIDNVSNMFKILYNKHWNTDKMPVCSLHVYVSNYFFSRISITILWKLGSRKSVISVLA